MERRQALKYVGIALGGILGLLLLAFLLGVIGVPTVEAVENRFGPVNETDTAVLTDLSIHNPNPIGISLGGTSLNYTVNMNDVAMATGDRSGLGIGAGTSTLNFTTYLKNERIPEWWYTHVSGGEVTDLSIVADVSVGLLLGQSFSFTQTDEIETNIIGAFNSSETRPLNASVPLVSNPLLYLNETQGTWGANITRSQTPIDPAFTLYNPKSYPYTLTEIGYTIRMNDVVVGNGSTSEATTIMPRDNETITTTSVIRNDALDEWWVSHIEHNQVTDLTIDFSIVVDPQTGDALGESVPPVRIDNDALAYQTTIETDIFGTKATANGTATSGESDSSGSPARDQSSQDTNDSGGGLVEVPETTATQTATETTDTTPTETTDDGLF